ncbi:hypothetical protein TanjilG_07045 [Lupinus angustifolius]|uniref:RRM domain-containing protein n=1 Tax=Lupinus angustifolius TaxID=3871 RepID=A0A4P1QXL3_LUPAN|nr:PREDICTED: uncharacterized protein LOC109328135 isoform X1 [Lupinus angustifolius]OIV97293.1 hypothetical protein TanjilG_07045 [Lupinus angustifolius]
MEAEDNNNRVRIFVGGLGETVTPQDLHRLFSSLGTVHGIQTIRTKGRSFAYVDFFPSPTDSKSLSKLFSKYNGCLWKGGKLKLEKAKENYLIRLKKEWEEAAAEEAVSSQPDTSDTANVDSDKVLSLEEMHKRKESLKTKQLHIFFPGLRKVKSIPFSGTGKHKYSFQNIKVPSMPVHFCDCEEHCSPSGTERGKLCFDQVAAESGGMNDEEINVMNAVMNKLLQKEKISNTKHLEKQQDSLESPDAVQSNESETGSGTDEDDIIINIQTNKSKAALTSSEELERILQSQESWLNKTRIVKEEPSKTMSELKKKNNNNTSKKRKSLPKLEKESNEGVSTTLGGKNSMQTLPHEVGSDGQPSDSEDSSFGETTKVSCFQKSSWKELLGAGGNTAFNASLILPKFDSGKGQQGSDSPSTPSSTKKKAKKSKRDGSIVSTPTNTQVIKEHAEVRPIDTQEVNEYAEAQPTEKNVLPNKADIKNQNMERDGYLLSKLTDTEVIKELAEAEPTSTQVIEEHAEAEPTGAQVIEEHAEAEPTSAQVIEEHTEAEPTDKNVVPKKTGRGASWLQKESWTQLVRENNSSFSISQILPGISFPEPMATEPIVYPVNSNDGKNSGVAKDTVKEVVIDGLNSGETVTDKSQHVFATDITSAPVVEEKNETEPMERTTEETTPKERSTEVVEVSETCSFMRNAASLKEWAKAKAALSGSLKRKRVEK